MSSAYETESFDTPPVAGDVSMEEFGVLGHILLLILPFVLLWFDSSKYHLARPVLTWLAEHHAAMIAVWVVYVAMSTHYLGLLRAAYSSDEAGLVLILTLGSSVGLMPVAFYYNSTTLTWTGVFFVGIGMVIAFAISGILYHTNILYWGPWRRNPDDAGITIAGFQG